MRKWNISEKPIFFIMLVVSALFLVLAFFGNSCFGKVKEISKSKTPNQKKVVLVIVNNIGIEDLTTDNSPNLYELANKTGAVGLMNTRTAGMTSAVNNHLTIGAGVKAAGGLWGGLAFNTDENYGPERAGDIYESRTGIKAPSAGVVDVAIADVSRQSQKYKLDIYPGSLGRSLKKDGLRIGVLGNADIREENGDDQTFHREAVLIAMDNLGRVPFGNVSRELTIDEPGSVGGFRTNYGALFNEAKQLLPKVDFLVIETGDTARVDEFANFLLDWEIPKQRAKALKAADNFVGRLVGQLDLDRTLLIVVSPTPSKQMRLQGNSLSPIIVAGPNMERGVLTSATTRRHGIVDSVDIAPTIISLLDGQIPFYMAGRPLSGEIQSYPAKYLAAQLQQISIKSQTRVPVLTTYVTTITVILMLSLVLLLIGEKGSTYLKLLQILLIWAIAVPLAMLFAAAFNYSFAAAPVLVALAISIVLVGLSILFKGHHLYPVIAVSLLTCIALILDTVSGAHLMQRSLLGYCPIIGARFYGIGNEYAGILIGSSVIGLTLLFDVLNWRNRLSFVAAGLLFILITFVIGYQALGANVGGAIAAVVAFVVTFFGILQGRVSLKHLLIVVGSVLLVISGLAVLDILQKGGNSHLGKAIILVQKGGFLEVVRIVQRKLAMNIKGTRYTVWTRILIAAIVIFPILFLRPVGAFAKISKEHPLLTAGYIGSACGAIAAFLFNDTGAAVAATIIIFSVVATLYIIMEEQIKKYGFSSG